MNKEEYRAAKKDLNADIKRMMEITGKGKTMVVGYGTGKYPIPESVSMLIRNELARLPKESAAIDVSTLKTLTIEKMANICLSKEFKKEFSELPIVEVFIEMKIMEAKLKEKENTILDKFK